MVASRVEIDQFKKTAHDPHLMSKYISERKNEREGTKYRTPSRHTTLIPIWPPLHHSVSILASPNPPSARTAGQREVFPTSANRLDVSHVSTEKRNVWATSVAAFRVSKRGYVVVRKPFLACTR